MNTLTMSNELLLPEVGKMVAEGFSVTLRGKGNSMLPFIIGDRDSVILCRPESLKSGDIVLAEIAEHHFVLHRIIKIENQKITLMGDGNLKQTEHCTYDSVLAKVVTIIRNGHSINPDSKKELRKVAIWKALKPIRRWILAIYRRYLKLNMILKSHKKLS